VLHLSPMLAPVKVAVLPLQKNKEELVTTAKELHHKLRRLMVCQYDDVANIGRRYRRQDEIGTRISRHHRLHHARRPDRDDTRARQHGADPSAPQRSPRLPA